MAYYTYKEVRDLIPDDFKEEFIKNYNERYSKFGHVYDDDANYNGGMWLLTAAYIEYLLKKCGT